MMRLLPLFGLLALVAGGELRLDGILGQSEPPTAEPLDFLGVSGLVSDNMGDLWMAAGDHLYCFAGDTDGVPRRRRTLRLPGAVPNRLGIRFDGSEIFAPTTDGWLHAIDPATDELRRVGPLDPTAMSFAVPPTGVAAGFAPRGPLVLDGDVVHDLQGNVVLELQRPADGRWDYRAIGIEPHSGDLLVASYYPDNQVYRYAADGQQVTAGWWPRPVFASRLQNVDGMTWALTGHGGIGLDPAVFRSVDAPRRELEWTFPIAGIARDARGRWWLGNSQGVARWDRPERPGACRLGGVPGIVGLAVSPAGSLLALAEGGARVLRLNADDLPAAPLLNNGNEPWRVGAGWTARATAIAWAGDGFLLTDRIGKRLWLFTPGTATWTPLTEPDTVPPATAVTAGDGLAWWALDGGIQQFRRTDLTSPPKSISWEQPIRHLAAADDRHLYAASDTRVYAPDWLLDLPDGKIAGIAATDDYLAVSDSSGRVLVATAAGAPLATLASAEVPGGMTPGAIAAFGRWIFVADTVGNRILRLAVSLDPPRTRR